MINKHTNGNVDKAIKKAFALEQIVPYTADGDLCAVEGTRCQYYMKKDGKILMCVLGKNLLHPEALAGVSKNGDALLYEYESEEFILRPEAVGKLTPPEWHLLQNIHDAMAKGSLDDILSAVGDLGLFTLDELNDASKEYIPVTA